MSVNTSRAVAAVAALVGLLGLQQEAAAEASGDPALGGAAKGERQVELLDISEEEITFRDESGKVVRIGEQIVVTGAKRAQRSWTSLSTISVIDRKDLASLPYFYLGDLLATLPGVDARWGKMQRYQIGVRGLGGTALNSRTLLLWDGIPLNDPFTGELRAGHFVPLVDIERVEVIRGAGSTLYGANAFSGVVNVITRPPDGKDEAVYASAMMGSFLTARAQAGFRQPAGPLQVSGSAEAFRTDGPFPTVQRFEAGKNRETKNDDAERVSLNAAVAYKGLRVGGEYLYGERGRPGTFPTDSSGKTQPCNDCHTKQSPFGQGIKYPATSTSCGSCHIQPTDREQLHRGRVFASYDHSFGKNVRLHADAYHHEYRTSYQTVRRAEYLAAAEEIDLGLKQRTSGAAVHVSHSWRQRNSVVAGGEVRRLETASALVRTPEGDQQVDQIEGGGFIEDEFWAFRWLSLTAGARLDGNSIFGAAFSPRGGLLFVPVDRLGIRFSVARAFRNPALSELYVLDQRGRYDVSGNPDLKREWITSFEGGISYLFTDPFVLRVGATVFYNRSTDLISFRATGLTEASFFNLDVADAIGGEAELELEILRKPNLRLFANYAYQHVADSDGEKLPYAPSSKLNAGLRLGHRRLGALARVRYVGSRMDNLQIKLPGFATLDASLSYRFWRRLNVQLWAQNVTGTDYQESLGIPGAPRSFFITVGYDGR